MTLANAEPRAQIAEHCTRAGAEELAHRLDEYWHSRGYPQVKHWVVPIGAADWKHAPTTDEFKGLRAFAVRSNLVNGMPPR